MVPVKALGELLENRILGIGRDTLDDQLLPRDADGESIPVLDEEQAETVRYSVDCYVEKRMPGWINGVLVQRDRELEQEISELAR
jgi:hypothetical protein